MYLLWALCRCLVQSSTSQLVKFIVVPPVVSSGMVPDACDKV